jgi:hypothetical protein
MFVWPGFLSSGEAVPEELDGEGCKAEFKAGMRAAQGGGGGDGGELAAQMAAFAAEKAKWEANKTPGGGPAGGDVSPRSGAIEFDKEAAQKALNDRLMDMVGTWEPPPCARAVH